MANPQAENGHIDIANEIVEVLTRFRLSGEEYQVLWVIWRKTYGWHKKEDCISLSQFFLLTNMKKPSIIRAIKKLIAKNVISKTANAIAYLYRFNKDYSTWKRLAKKLIVSKRANKSLAKELPTKENYTKETTMQPTVAEQELNNQITTILKKFETINPFIKKMYGNKTQRQACRDLIEEKGFVDIIAAVEYAIQVFGKPYAPQITTPYELKAKYPKLLIYKNK